MVIGRAFADRITAAGAACTFSLAVAAVVAATYALDGGAQDGGIGLFESDARAAAQLSARVAVFFTFESAVLREAGDQSPYGVPNETLEAVAPLACAALFGIWFLFSYPEKTEKPVYQDIGSLRGGKEEADRKHWGGAPRDGGGPRAVALSPLHTFPQNTPPPSTKKKPKNDLLPTSAPPPPRPQPQSVSFHFTL